MHDNNRKAWCEVLKMQKRIIKTIKMLLLISVATMGLTGLIIYSILNNYISKINIIDNSSSGNMKISNNTTPAVDKEELSSTASELREEQEDNKFSEQEQTVEAYEVYQSFLGQLNMQEPGEKQDSEEASEASGLKQDGNSVSDTPVFNITSLSNIVSDIMLDNQNAADVSLNPYKEAGGKAQENKAAVRSGDKETMGAGGKEEVGAGGKEENGNPQESKTADIWQDGKATGIEQNKKPADTGKSSNVSPGVQEDTDIVEPIIDDKVMNLLLIGHDAICSDNTSPESFAILTVNKRTKKLVTTTLANNLYLYIPDIGKERLLTAYRSGGTELLIKTLEKNFGVVIDAYVMADYSAYIDIVDIIDGVEIVLAKEEIEPVNRNIREINKQLGHSAEADIITGKGLQLLNGKQALGYSRNWYTPKGELISYGNQKAVILSILNKVKSFNLIQMNGFLNEVLPMITTNLPESRILELIIMLPSYFKYGTENLSLPVQGSEKKRRVNGRTVLEYNVEENLSQLYRHLYAKQ